ncbi:hypothetical protein BU15DRAFT_63220 [Melanogaster broomeanus]|nr:hypothetical protein BU15DRAFT_63220 [Melanogaster broomeanus]
MTRNGEDVEEGGVDVGVVVNGGREEVVVRDGEVVVGGGVDVEDGVDVGDGVDVEGGVDVVVGVVVVGSEVDSTEVVVGGVDVVRLLSLLEAMVVTDPEDDISGAVVVEGAVVEVGAAEDDGTDELVVVGDAVVARVVAAVGFGEALQNCCSEDDDIGTGSEVDTGGGDAAVEGADETEQEGQGLAS